MENIIKILKNAETLAILAHISEDPDAIGSSFALADVLERLGKKTTCFMSEKLKDNLDYIMRDYVVFDKNTDVEEYDVCICLDAGDIDRLGDRVAIFNKAKTTVNIDHHYTNTEFADYNWVEGNSAATGQMLFGFLKKLGDINEYTAKCLYTAISTDTGCFKYSNVTPATLRVVADLLEYNISHADITRILFDTEDYSVMQLRAKVMNSVKKYYDGKMTLVVIDEQMYNKYGVEENSVGDFVDIPRRIRGCDVAVCLKKRDDKVKISLRSNGRVNVADAAVKIGGGGHKMAAGAALDMSIEDAEKTVVDLFKEVI